MTEQQKPFAGKTALITGASRGIGYAIALRLAQEGASIAAVYAGNDEAAQKAVADFEAAGAQAKAYRCDVSDFTATGALCAEVIDHFGGVDILVNNAGIVRDALILSMKEEDFDDVVSTNLKGAFNMTKHLYHHFMRKRAGRIVNITSVIGRMGNAGQANYAAAKAGLIGLTKSTARELAARGVTCNAVAPGFIDTDMTNTLSDKVRSGILDSVPAKRMGRPEEVAAAVAFLAGDGAAYITGQVIGIDGGLYM